MYAKLQVGPYISPASPLYLPYISQVLTWRLMVAPIRATTGINTKVLG